MLPRAAERHLRAHFKVDPNGAVLCILEVELVQTAAAWVKYKTLGIFDQYWAGAGRVGQSHAFGPSNQLLCITASGNPA